LASRPVSINSRFSIWRLQNLSTAREKEEAKEWLNINNEGFKEVCENAGFNPYFVYKLIIKLMKGKVKTNVR
jgi:hypothetical protein